MLENLPEALGHALMNQRAGMQNVLYNELHRLRQTTRMEVHSAAFAFNARLPARLERDCHRRWRGVCHLPMRPAS